MKKIIFTGPECSGKTTLTQRLAKTLKLPYTSEYVRHYLNLRKGSNYKVYACELARIVYGQIVHEHQFGEAPMVIYDTNILSNLVYIEYYFKVSPNWLHRIFKRHCAGFYILLKPNIPFQPDPQRTGGQERQDLFYIFRAKLKEHDLDFSVINSSRETERLKIAMKKCLELQL